MTSEFHRRTTSTSPPDSNDEDSYRPDFGQGWDFVPAGRALDVEVTLWDEDTILDADDSIGIVNLNRDDIFDALRAGEVFQVPVWDQFPPRQRSILFIGILVRDQSGT
jgi:hypothetical protein